MSPDFSSTWIPVEIDAYQAAFEDGVTCHWSIDPSVGTDNVLTFAWAPADATEWAALVEEVKAQDPAWFILAEERGDYLTIESEYWVHDDEGYGTTYLFTGDAIILAGTKAETSAVTGPPLVEVAE
jgi:hypothetical protein